MEALAGNALAGVKLIAALLIVVIATAGSLLAVVFSSTSARAMQCLSSFAAGVLMVVALVGMLPENAPRLNSIGKQIASTLHRHEPFPFGNAVFLIGFMLIPTVEALIDMGSHDHSSTTQVTDGGAVESGERRHEGDSHGPVGPDSLRGLETNHSMLHHASTVADLAVKPSHSLSLQIEPSQKHSTASSFSERIQHIAEQKAAVNVSTTTLWVGLSTHALLEGIAVGTAEDASSVLSLMIAIGCHKGFEAFALSSALLPLWTAGRKRLWMLLNFLFGTSTALGIAAGAVLSTMAEGTGVAVVNCIAAGTLLHIGVCEMLVPSLADAEWRKRKLMVTLLSSCVMCFVLALSGE